MNKPKETNRKPWKKEIFQAGADGFLLHKKET